jgi:serine/threonine protein kinase
MESSLQNNTFELPIGRFYTLDAKRKIGSGGFGVVYEGKRLEDGKEVAIKLEKIDTLTPTLGIERRFIDELQGVEGIPRVYKTGRQGNYNFMVMDLLGSNLNKLYDYCNREFSLKTVVMLADIMLSRIKAIHKKGIINRDIKPENFLLGGKEDRNTIYLIDFGLSKMYKDKYNGKHISFRSGKTFHGTTNFASISNHIGLGILI